MGNPRTLHIGRTVPGSDRGWEPNAETAEDIFRFCRERLAPYKRIRRLEFGDLPKTISGKIRRVDLRKREEELSTTGSNTPGAEFREEDFPALKR
jgi:acetyl-CoA synthetase